MVRCSPRRAVLLVGLIFVCYQGILLLRGPAVPEEERPLPYDYIDEQEPPDPPLREDLILKAAHEVKRRKNNLAQPSIQCNRTEFHQDTISCLDRAKTEECRNIISNVACEIIKGRFYAESDLLKRHALPECVKRTVTPTAAAELMGEVQGPLRIAFMIVANGRSYRQLARLIRAIHHPDHYYLLHIDSKSDYLYENIAKYVSQFSNVWLTEWRLDTIWGSSNLYEVYVRGMKDMLAYDWDYFFNLSETDFPTRPVTELADHLKQYRKGKYNFLKTHGGDFNSFVKKQGMDQTFVLCERHMWRLGPRHLPNLTYEGASDWFTLHRSFAEYVTSEDPFIMRLRHVYDYSLLSAENFFHVVASNSEFCSTFVSENQRFANWNRKRGCQCQYKAIVDWCGCSPMVFQTGDLPKLKSNNVFMARKFDPKINFEIINSAERDLLGITNDLNKYYFWESQYTQGEDVGGEMLPQMTYYSSFTRDIMAHFNDDFATRYCRVELLKIVEVNAVFQPEGFKGFTVLLSVSSPDTPSHPLLIEGLMLPKPHLELFDKNLQNIEIGTHVDDKELIFKRFGGLLTVKDLRFASRETWVKDTKRTVQLVWKHEGLNFQMTTSKGIVGDIVAMHKADVPETLIKPGKYKMELYQNETLLGTALFPVIPVSASLEPARDVDVLVREFWTMQSICVKEKHSCYASLPLCAKSTWSSISENNIVH